MDADPVFSEVDALGEAAAAAAGADPAKSSPLGGEGGGGSWVVVARNDAWPTPEELAEQQGALALQLIGCLDKLPDAAAEAVANRLISPTARFLLQGKIFRGPRGYLQHRLRVRTFWAPGFEIHVEDVRHDRTGELPGHQDAPTTRVSWTLKGRPWDGPAAQGSDVRMSSGSDMDADAAAEGSSEGGNGVEPTVTARGVTVLSFEGHTCVGGMNSYDFQRACQSLSPSAFGGAPSAAGGSAVATPLQTGELRREPRPHGVNEMEALRHYRRATQRARGGAGGRSVSNVSVGTDTESEVQPDTPDSMRTSPHAGGPGVGDDGSVSSGLAGADGAGVSAPSSLSAPFEISPDEVSFGTPPVRLGIGSYGEVFKAKWRGTTVAVKRLLDQSLGDDALAEMRAELEILAQLRHPNIVLWLAACTRPGSAFIVTEFMSGGSLFSLLHKTKRPLPRSARLGLAVQVAQGMLYLHSLPQPLVHRDLSSNNVLIDRRGNAKICDFGLSRQMALSTEGGSAAPLVTTKGTGTAEYTAPEILRIGSGMPGSSDGGAQQVLYSEKVDVYSFGTLLWEILTRRVPWQHAGLGTLQVITQLAIRGSAATVATLRMDAADPFRSGKEVDVVPPQLVELIHACFSDDPQLRPGFEDIGACHAAAPPPS
eukprot:PRCOL_00006459-RA